MSGRVATLAASLAGVLAVGGIVAGIALTGGSGPSARPSRPAGDQSTATTAVMSSSTTNTPTTVVAPSSSAVQPAPPTRTASSVESLPPRLPSPVHVGQSVTAVDSQGRTVVVPVPSTYPVAPQPPAYTPPPQGTPTMHTYTPTPHSSTPPSTP